MGPKKIDLTPRILSVDISGQAVQIGLGWTEAGKTDGRRAKGGPSRTKMAIYGQNYAQILAQFLGIILVTTATLMSKVCPNAHQFFASILMTTTTRL